jgi:hypothetical protein
MIERQRPFDRAGKEFHDSICTSTKFPLCYHFECLAVLLPDWPTSVESGEAGEYERKARYVVTRT